jgi:hypothetical protein
MTSHTRNAAVAIGAETAWLLLGAAQARAPGANTDTGFDDRSAAPGQRIIAERERRMQTRRDLEDQHGALYRMLTTRQAIRPRLNQPV